MNGATNALGHTIVAIRKKLGMTWPEVAARRGQAPVWTTAACLGQMSMSPETAAKARALFGFGDEERASLDAVPYPGSLPTAVPTDPLIYRFYELVMVYGTTWKALIEKEFGDGTMRAVDFDVTPERQPDQTGDRVRVAVSGKFLPYKRY